MRSPVTLDLTVTPLARKMMRQTTKKIYQTWLWSYALMSNLTETCLQRVIGEQLAHRAANREEGNCLDVSCFCYQGRIRKRSAFTLSDNLPLFYVRVSVQSPYMTTELIRTPACLGATCTNSGVSRQLFNWVQVIESNLRGGCRKLVEVYY